MRSGIAWILALWFLGGGELHAPAAAPAPTSEEKTLPDEKAPASGSSGQASVDLSPAASSSPGYCLWAQADYLLWWVKAAPLPVPLVTTGDPAVGFDPTQVNTVNTAGAIGQPGTRVLLGDHSVDLPVSSGVRLTLGGWFDEDQRVGVEGSGFLLERFRTNFFAASDNAGFPPLYFPIFSAIAGAERGIPIADPLRGFSGAVAVPSSLKLGGVEANVLFAYCRTSYLSLSLLAGFRYADLRESLQIHNSTTDLLFGNVMILNDSFATTNQFYGGQIGGRLGVQFDRLSLDFTGKFAAGSAHQIVNIQGDITQAGPNPLVPPGLGTFPGGLFAQTTNIGHHNANPLSVPFVVLPSLDFRVGWQVTDRLGAFVGYEVLYWTRVVRPGNEINHIVNLSQNAVLDPNGVGVLVGAAEPAPLFIRSAFWAQGVSLGLEFRY
jgi:hypothetical protein